MEPKAGACIAVAQRTHDSQESVLHLSDDCPVESIASKYSDAVTVPHGISQMSRFEVLDTLLDCPGCSD